MIRFPVHHKTNLHTTPNVRLCSLKLLPKQALSKAQWEPFHLNFLKGICMKLWFSAPAAPTQADPESVVPLSPTMFSAIACRLPDIQRWVTVGAMAKNTKKTRKGICWKTRRPPAHRNWLAANLPGPAMPWQITQTCSVVRFWHRDITRQDHIGLNVTTRHRRLSAPGGRLAFQSVQHLDLHKLLGKFLPIPTLFL